MTKTVLIVDDDPLLTASVAFNLEKAGYKALTATTSEEALTAVQCQPPDVILLDIGLPDMDGLETIRVLQRKASIPVIFVTARRRELDEIVGLELGAEDYITKPFDMDVLLTRIKVVLRRGISRKEAQPTQVTVGDLQINYAAHTVQLGERFIEMSPKEFAILLLLAREAGRVFSIEEIIERVWGKEWIGETQTIYVHIRWLREKIERDPTHPGRLLTVKGAGYKLLPIIE